MKKLVKSLICKSPKCPNGKNIRRGRCEACVIRFKRNNCRITKLRNTYTSMNQRCNNINNIRSNKYFGMEICTRSDFMEKFKNCKKFNKLYDNWIESDRNYKLLPTIDRINKNLGYNISNIEFITSSQNSKKDVDSTPVMCIKGDSVVGIYYGIMDASKDTGANRNCIRLVINKKRKTANGYIFERLEDE